MFSGLIAIPNSVNSPEYPLFDRIPSNFRTFLNLSDPCLTFFRRVSFLSDVSRTLSTLIVGSTAVVTILMLSSLAWLLCSKKKRAKSRSTLASLITTEVTRESPEDDTQRLTLIPTMNDALFNDNKADAAPLSDAKYAEELQVQEALLASLLDSQIADNASSSVQARAVSNPKLAKIASEVDEPSKGFCEICFENKERWQMFGNESCTHSFCYECTSKHIVAKIQENIKEVTCPGVNCNAILDFDVCRLIIPKDVLVRWDESLCQSLILESQKLYCPFRDCSAMLVHDTGETVREINCPVCQRSFCALCCVPWHSEFSCEEFQKLNAKRKGKDVMVQLLAKKKNWQKCPRCKMFVEKSAGCLHITCRCGYEFCYRCGSKWSGSHTGCRKKS